MSALHSSPLRPLLFILILLLPFQAFAQGSGKIVGQVTDKATGDSIPFANILLEKDGKEIMGTEADARGHFELKPVRQGIYQLVAAAVGYQNTRIKGIEVKKKEKVEVEIEVTSDSTQLNEVKVTGRKVPLVKKGNATKDVSTQGKPKSLPARSATEVSKSVADTYQNPEKTEDLPESGQLTAGEIHDLGKWEPWKKIREEDSNGTGDVWGIEGQERYSVIVQNHDGMPLIDARVDLRSTEGKTLWRTRTDNTGKAELWRNPFPAQGDAGIPGELVIQQNGEKKSVEAFHSFDEGVNLITMPGECRNYENIDILFTVDATGSMGDEIEHIHSELRDIIDRIGKERSGSRIRIGSIFYQCPGDQYITKTSPLDPDIQKTLDFMASNPADGGGTEAVEEALEASVEAFEDGKREGRTARLLFLVLDEPPGKSDEIVRKYQDALKRAASKGIRVVPVVASGTGFGKDKSLEFLMRPTAILSNGTYTFLTDHSGIGNEHTKPTTDSYEVTYMNDLLVDISKNFTYVPSCDEEAEQKADTVFVDREVIDEVVLDSTDSPTASVPDTNEVVIGQPDTSKGGDTLASDQGDEKSDPDSTDPGIEKETVFKLYPNPTQGPLTIEFDTEEEVQHLMLADISGSSIRKIRWEGSGEKRRKRIDLSDLPSGIYLVRAVIDEDESLDGRVVLSRR